MAGVKHSYLSNKPETCLLKKTFQERESSWTNIAKEAHGIVKQKLHSSLLWPEVPLGGAESLLLGGTDRSLPSQGAFPGCTK